MKRQDITGTAPLADRMRPKTLEEFVGQEHLLGEGRILHRLLEKKHFQSLILWGPPGCGKTTLAHLMVQHTDAHLIFLSAVMAGTKDIREAAEEARRVWIRTQKKTWVFLDEIHRLNKSQQDALLPHVEKGIFYLLGATTENPSFEVIRPLLSRCRVLTLKALEAGHLKTILQRALSDGERGLGLLRAELSQDAEGILLEASGGDARVLLNLLEMAVLTTPPDPDGKRRIAAQSVVDVLERRPAHYDKSGEEHYNLISAFHKSLRGSDPDAALYWMARMLEAGEDPLYVARRLIVAASEDVGLADPFALVQAVNAFQAYQMLGSPEGELMLAQAAVYVALAPKSNSVYTALKKARGSAGATGTEPVPMHLRNAPTQLLKELGYGRYYKYPHDYPEGWVPETYFPSSLAGTVFYEPRPRGWEGKWREYLDRRRQAVQKERASRPKKEEESV
ncbi:Recombination protein MgsA [Desulfacinum infernum DSM 9756]|uniref:Replication-associated recombination protein A n=1 Tax=Desulfacinum infernum DSM 9756 TaxID=1121391 RepID=A0A1M4UQ94_9BACT|nr:replication-associated recombination protein A [Desulfacinum infernum]SHE58884.1 Recombination protein MgsA [Desulfacinum infernum DSM 9756]